MKYRADIDGLRGLAVLFVVAFHADVSRIFESQGLRLGDGGFVGVDVFFVLSGFLITENLVDEAERLGGVSLAAFYRRRIRRLLPAAAAVVLGTIVAACVVLPRLEWRGLGLDALASASSVANLRFGARAATYFTEGLLSSPFLHFWSLGLEEQYYLFVPVLIAAVTAGAVAPRRRVLLVSLGILFASFAACVVLTATGSVWAYYGPHSRIWELALGGVITCVPPPRLPGATWTRVGVVGVAMIAAAGLLFTRATAFPGTAALVPVGGTALVLLAGRESPEGLIARALASRPLTSLGSISYPLYLVHWPLLALTGPATWTEHPPAYAIGIAVILGLVAAVALHHLIERPARKSALLASGGWPFALFGLVWMVVASLAALLTSAAEKPEGPSGLALAARLDRPNLQPAGCEADYFDVAPRPCVLGQGDGPPAVVLLGDSHAAQLAPALADALARIGLTGWLFTKASCPPVDVRRFLPAYNRDYSECEEWRQEVFELIRAVRPAVVYVARFGGYSKTLVLDGFPGANTPAAVWRAGAARAIHALETEVVFVRDTPEPSFDVPRCVARGERCGLTLGAVRWDTDLFDAESAAIEESGAADVVDPNDAICPPNGAECASIDAHGYLKFRDGNHLTATFARTLAPVFEHDLRERWR